jgi:energy-converting hydrogenase Eha subunit E
MPTARLYNIFDWNKIVMMNDEIRAVYVKNSYVFVAYGYIFVLLFFIVVSRAIW